MKRLFALVLAVVMVVLVGCETGSHASGIVVFAASPSKRNTENFLKLFDESVNPIESHIKEYIPIIERDNCYNITPSEISDQYGFQLFKFEQSGMCFLNKGNTVCLLGNSFGGYGAVSFAVGDLNDDGNSELYYTFSFGSGQHSSHIGYIDLATLSDTVFAGTLYEDDIMLSVNNGVLSLYKADVTTKDGEFSFVDFGLAKKGEPIGEIVYSKKQIVLKTIGDSLKAN